MNFTRELVVLAATALAWFAYALVISQPELTDPLLGDVSRTAALVLSGFLGVRIGGLLLVEGLMETVWGVPSNALIRLVVYLALTLFAMGVVLKVGLDLDLATLLTTSALLTAILGFAMQSTLAAFFSGVALQIERHIRPGDGIVVEGGLAIVETIGWRSMTARRGDGSLIMVPNTAVANGAVPIRRPGELTRTGLRVEAPLSAPPAMMADIIREAVLTLPDLATDRAVSVELAELRPQEGIAVLKAGFSSRPASPDASPKEALARLRIWYAYQRYGIVLPRAHAQPDAGELALLGSASYPAELPERLFRAFGEARRWRSAERAELERLARAGRRLLYAPDEPILLPRDFNGASVLLVSGEVRQASRASGAVSDIEPAIHQSSGPGESPRWDMEVLLRVEAELAEAIGPYAHRAVQKASPQAGDLGGLYRLLADLIENPGKRQAFLELGPSASFREFRPGTVFVAQCIGSNPAAPPVPLFAVDHVELLAIPAGAGAAAVPNVASAAGREIEAV